MFTETSVSMISQGCVFNELNNTTVKYNMLHYCMRDACNIMQSRAFFIYLLSI